MAQIYDSIKSLITSKRISTAAGTLSESETKVSNAASIILPALLGAVLKEKSNDRVKEVVQDSGKAKIKNDLDAIWEGSGVIDGKNFGERMENALIGSDNTKFRSEVAAKAGISSENADRLSNWVAATIAAFMGEKVVGEKVSFATFISDLEKEKAIIKKDIPSKVYSSLGLASVMGAYETAENKSTVAEKPKKKKGMGWLWWLIIIIVALLLIWLLSRSCRDRRVTDRNTTPIEQVQQTPPASTSNSRETTQITLPDGTVITVYRNGEFQKMVEYLNSNEYKNATADDLSKKWFHFEGIDFVHDSSSELMAGSSTYLNSLVSILKAYPNAKIRIGGYADKTGPEWANEEISKERAEYIKRVFNQNNIDRVSTEGFGEEFATVPADASDAERAKDRSIALRFVK